MDPAPSSPSASRVGRRYTPEELEFIRRNRDTMRVDDLARALGRTQRGIAIATSKRGLRKQRVRVWKRGEPRAGKRWLPVEDQALFDLPIDTISRARATLFPGRTWQAILDRRRRLGLTAPAREHDGWLTLHAVARLYDCSRARVRRLISEGELPAYRSPAGAWRIAPEDAEAVEAALRAPQRTWKGGPPDCGWREKEGRK